MLKITQINYIKDLREREGLSPFHETIKIFGEIDILFNNAGVELLTSFTDTTIEDLNKVIDINLKGTYFVTKAAILAI